ncbi:MAG TPA: hypothetical protein VHF25_15275 [Nitriliruptorales bacterium]|nr:hypothetical protein [Nitriliruptorales bacterium]
MQSLIVALTLRLAALRDREDGFSTAELLGNAALGVIALVVIWAALQTTGVNIVQWIEQKLLGSGG